MYIFIIIIIIVLAIAIPAGIARTKRVNREWEAAARELQLGFTPAAFLQRREIDGQLAGAIRVRVDTYSSGGKHKKTYTRFRISFPRLPIRGLHFSRQSFFTGITKWFGAQDIEIGEASFDKDVVVKGSNSKAVHQFLNPARRMRIYRFLMNFDTATINDTSIEWRTRGLMSRRSSLVSHVKAFVRLAWHLTDDRPEDDRLSRAMSMQNNGAPEVALETLNESIPLAAVVESTDASQVDPPEPAFVHEPVEEQILQGELHLMAGDQDKAREAFQQAKRVSSDDTELNGWIELSESPAPPTPDASLTQVDAKTVCDQLFREVSTSYEANRIFDERFKGQQIVWTGVLKKVETNYSSFVFERSGGTTASITIDELESPYVSKDISAFVHLSDSALTELRDQIGDSITFRGKLIRVDGLMRNIYVEDGEVLQDP